MLNVARLRGRERVFVRVVGLSPGEFDTLLAQVEATYEEVRAQHLQRRSRRRAVGAGRRHTWPLEARLLATLVFFRLHISGALLSCLFDLEESTLWRERTLYMLPVLEQVLPVPMQDHLLSGLEPTLPEGAPVCSAQADQEPHSGKKTKKSAKRIGTLQELLERYPELRDICIDGTEQRTPRPKNKKDAKTHYSGKSHGHTLKAQLTTAKRLILHVTGNCPGSVADAFLLKASGVLRAMAQAASPWTTKQKQGKRPRIEVREKWRRVRLDRGYSTIERAYPGLAGVQVLAAISGRGKHKATPLARAWNRVVVSPKRMQVEQNIGHLKNWRVLAGTYRARRHTHQTTLALVAGLHNFRQLGQLAW